MKKELTPLQEIIAKRLARFKPSDARRLEIKYVADDLKLSEEDTRIGLVSLAKEHDNLISLITEPNDDNVYYFVTTWDLIKLFPEESK